MFMDDLTENDPIIRVQDIDLIFGIVKLHSASKQIASKVGTWR